MWSYQDAADDEEIGEGPRLYVHERVAKRLKHLPEPAKKATPHPTESPKKNIITTAPSQDATKIETSTEAPVLKEWSPSFENFHILFNDTVGKVSRIGPWQCRRDSNALQ